MYQIYPSINHNVGIMYNEHGLLATFKAFDHDIGKFNVTKFISLCANLFFKNHDNI